MMDALEKHLLVNQLFWHYGAFLTDRQNEVIQYYYEENYSLHEISELLKVSRNAVHDQLKRAVGKLNDYEKKLGLKAKEDARRQLIEQLEGLTEDTQMLSLLEQLKKVE